jgi:predicted nucleic acid-binding protein
VDTDVLIWYFRGNTKARTALESAHPFAISVVTHMELMQGMADKAELNRFQRSLREWGIAVVHINEAISAKAAHYVEAYHLSHSMMLADALIAATAVEMGETLLTGHVKHYRVVPTIELRRFSEV